MSDITDEELDKIIKDEIKPDIEQDDSVDNNVKQHLGEMGFLWDRVQHKLHDDGICFSCKQPLTKETKLHVLMAGKTDKGVCAFCGICDSCFKKMEELNNDKTKTK